MDNKIIAFINIYRKKINNLLYKSIIENNFPDDNIKINIDYKNFLKKTSHSIIATTQELIPSINNIENLDFDELGYIKLEPKKHIYSYKDYKIEIILNSSYQYNSYIFYKIKISKDNESYEIESDIRFDTNKKKHFAKNHLLCIKYFKDGKRHPIFTIKRTYYFFHKNLKKEIYILSKTGGGSLFITYGVTKKEEIKFKKFDYNYHSLLDKDEKNYLKSINKELSHKGYLTPKAFLEYKDYMSLIKDINVLDAKNDIFTKKYNKIIRILNK